MIHDCGGNQARSKLVCNPVIRRPLVSTDHVTAAMQAAHIEIAAEILLRTDHLLLVCEQAVEMDGYRLIAFTRSAKRSVKCSTAPTFREAMEALRLPTGVFPHPL